MNQRVAERAGLQMRLRLQIGYPRCRSKIALAIGYRSEALRPAQATLKLAGHLKMLELAMTGIAAIQSGFVRS
jgi:hypothetical protein